MIQFLRILFKKSMLSISIVFFAFNVSFAQKVDILLDSANSYYSSANYINAIENYEEILTLGYVSAELYYNLGNAYFKNNQLSSAILNYERAKLYSPQDEYIINNIEIARTYVEDKIDVIPEFFISKWIDTVKYSFTSDNWAIYSIAGFIIFLLLFLFYLFSTKQVVKKFTFWLGLVFLFASVFSFWFSYIQKETLSKHEQAIIFDPTVTIKGSPDESGTELFLLHEGTKVQLLDSLGAWIEIKISDGNVGWLKTETIRRI